MEKTMIAPINLYEIQKRTDSFDKVFNGKNLKFYADHIAMLNILMELREKALIVKEEDLLPSKEHWGDLELRLAVLQLTDAVT